MKLIDRRRRSIERAVREDGNKEKTKGGRGGGEVRRGGGRKRNLGIGQVGKFFFFFLIGKLFSFLLFSLTAWFSFMNCLPSTREGKAEA